MDAVRELAHKYGVKLVESQEERKEYDRRSQILMLYQLASEYYIRLLQDPQRLGHGGRRAGELGGDPVLDEGPVLVRPLNGVSLRWRRERDRPGTVADRAHPHPVGRGELAGKQSKLTDFYATKGVSPDEVADAVLRAIEKHTLIVPVPRRQVLVPYLLHRLDHIGGGGMTSMLPAVIWP